MSIPAGDLNRRIIIEQKSSTVDGTNQKVNLWTPFKPKWSKPLGLTGLAAIRAADESLTPPPGRYSWRMRFDLTITVAHRVNYKGHIFDIRDVRHDFAAREYTDLVCEYGGNNG